MPKRYTAEATYFDSAADDFLFVVEDGAGNRSRAYTRQDAKALRDWLNDRANGYSLSREAEARIYAAG